MSRFSIRVCAAGGIGALALVGVVRSAVADHAWGDYQWARRSNPFTLQLIDSVTANWQAQLTTAQADWSTSTVLDLALAQGDETTKTRKQCSAVQGKVRVCNAAYGQNGWLGLAQIWLDSNHHIYAGVTKMNDSYEWYFTPEEKQHVMCQEIGHIFGLDHQDESGAALGTCMDYSTDPGSQHPNQHDYDMLAQIYQHLDGYDSFSSGSGGGGGGCKGRNCGNGAPQAAGDDGDWGHLINAHGRGEVYARRLPNGQALITHVFLVESR